MIKIRNKKNTAFTLIELLVVISIISLLSTIVLANIKTSRERAAVVKIKEIGEQIKIALELYKSDHGDYPTYNSFQIDPWTGTYNLGSLGPYIKDIPLTNNGLSSFEFRNSAIYGNAIYYDVNYATSPTFNSCANIEPGKRPPYTVFMVIDPYDFDLNAAYGFHHFTDQDGVNPYNNMYCLFTPPY